MKLTLEEVWLSTRYVTDTWFEGYDEHKSSNPKLALKCKTTGIVKYDQYYDHISTWDFHNPLGDQLLGLMKSKVGEP